MSYPPPSSPTAALPAGPAAPAAPPAGPRCIDSDAVFAGAREVVIRHHGTDYRLRQTGLGKLILTK